MPRSSILAFMAALALCACNKAPVATSVVPAQAPPASAQPPAAAAMPAMPVPASLDDWAQGATLFGGLGRFHRQVTTSSDDAQQYFDQGMRFLWAFNHDEAARSFAKAAQFDPQCASCFWGVALTVGPNYNAPVMVAERAKVAWAALQAAQQHAAASTPVEQALIAALGKRYSGEQALDPSNDAPLLRAYASAMDGVSRKFPDDLDVQTLAMEAAMNVNAWKLWSNDGKPAAGTIEIEKRLEAVLARDPRHPGANHYYVHTMEASPHPEMALTAAQTLDGMMPMAGHLQHMPAHIFQRVGRYSAAAGANLKGISADRVYLEKTHPLDYYGMYVAHNYQFLAYSTAMLGQQKKTLDAVGHLRDAFPEAMLAMAPGVDWYLSEIYSAYERFGMWDEMLAEKAPDSKFAQWYGGYLYARASAQAAKGQVDEAAATLAQLVKLSTDTPKDAPAGLNIARDVYAVAIPIVNARIAIANHKQQDALTQLRRAVAAEDRLAYDEPADWFVPSRHLLGAQLLAAGNAHEAEAVYARDLAKHPHNGWALFGLSEALKAQKKDASKVDAELADAWQSADTKLTASAL